MEIIFWIFILFTVVYEPIIGYYGFKKFEERVVLFSEARLKYYKNIMLGLWIPTLFIIFVILFSELTFEDVGITLPTINSYILGPIITYTTLAIAAFYFIVLIFYIVSYYLNESFRKKFIESKKKQLNEISFGSLIPVTKKEKKAWTYVSITAGVTEEIIYRGFLIFAIAYLFPSLSIWLVMLAASVLFGLAHTYQGKGDVVRTTIIGYIFSILYIGLGSILPIIVLHFLIDYVAKLGDEDGIV